MIVEEDLLTPPGRNQPWATGSRVSYLKRGIKGAITFWRASFSQITTASKLKD